MYTGVVTDLSPSQLSPKSEWLLRGLQWVQRCQGLWRSGDSSAAALTATADVARRLACGGRVRLHLVASFGPHGSLLNYRLLSCHSNTLAT